MPRTRTRSSLGVLAGLLQALQPGRQRACPLQQGTRETRKPHRRILTVIEDLHSEGAACNVALLQILVSTIYLQSL